MNPQHAGGHSSLRAEANARPVSGVANTLLPATGAPRRAVRVVLVAFAVIALAWVLYRVQGVLFLLVLSVLFAYLVAPLVAAFRRPLVRKHALPLPLAILLAYLLIFGLAAGVGALLVPVLNDEFAELKTAAPAYLSQLQAGWQAWQKGQTRTMPRNIRVAIDGIVNQATTAGDEYLRHTLLPRIGGWLIRLPWLILVPIFSFFLIKDAERIRRSALNFFPRGQPRWRGDVFFEDVNRTLAAYIRAQIFAGFVVAAVCTGGFFLLGVPYAAFLGLAAGLLEFLPIVGPFVVALSAVCLAGFQSASRALEVGAFLLAVRIVQDYIVYPKIVSKRLPLHPLAVILAILCGGELAGVAGVFLAIPALAVLTIAYRHWQAHRRDVRSDPEPQVP